MYKQILVPLGGSRFAEYALPHAIALASRWGAGVELATVAEAAEATGSPEGLKGDDTRERGEAQAEEYLAEVEARLREVGFPGPVKRTVLPAGNIAISLVRHAGSGETDLVIMTTHGRGPVRRAWLGSVADGVIRRSPVPILLVRPHVVESEVDTSVDLTQAVPETDHAMVPLDGSPAAERVLPLVRPLLGEGGRVVLFQCIPPLTPGAYPYLPHAVREEQQHEEVRKAARSYLEEVANRLRRDGWDVEVAVGSSLQPGVAILNAAEEEDVQLIGMSTEGRGGISRLLLGSVADKVVRGSSVPVLLYREPETG